MNVKETATAIVELIGGKENIAHLEHCSTRLRFTLKDNSLVQKDALEKVDGVIGVRQNVQCQVIIGNDVVEVYDEVMNVLGHELTADGGSEGKQKQSWGAVLLDFIISIFQPLIPAVAGGGVLKSLLLLASVTGLMDNTSQTYQILNLIGGAPLYFLPILVAITTANKLKVNQLVAVSAVGALILPELTTLLTDGAAFMGFGLQNIAYASQVFPAILTVLFYAQIEKLFTRISPKPIRIFFVPMMSLVITVPVALLILGPLGFEVGTIFSAAIIWLYAHLGWVATGILAAVLPLMVVTGMHKAMIPYAVSSMSEMGAELLYLPASLAHNIAEAGACFAVSVRTKDQKLRSTAVSAGISALFGITEPALYGVTILHKRVLYGVMASSLVGGAVAGLFAIKAFALVGPGLASITMFVDEANPMNLVWALVTLGVSFAVSFVLVLFLFKDKVVENKTTVADPKAEVLSKPVDGQVVALSEVNDEVFSSGMIGEGFGIIPTSGELIAPEDGEITMLFETNHAIGLKTRNGAELLFHIGLDTVQLEGKHFTPYVKAGDQVKQGQPLIQFDLDAIKAAGFDPIVICVVTNQENFTVKPIESTDERNEQGVLSIAPIV
ncbi:beta-glucoside-specific PTS transporter subunit IIABC [Enterococcus casseliflavus]|uniref:beta-glucoside-specific PTS transporter subunit IIABC n=1 Tax=Enterococcus casseliflavus TaxID=37734 RepID=UPI0009C027A5|nr:beta-glucoside-specific PTS transporter subunit IIABC [Enterococcus casseliflavus]MBZ3640075.1 PTS glucose transporter subunit IIA [Enterococcus casseliflavus]MCD5200451.1 PTS glucose transporter subunit IIA [Enterococcus casseliflavus]MDV7736418.1 beta-glucoside-specific PTS transporter subunit IIABC [Enterococcus casseliflavus]MRI69770.1 PTS beta-glucoside transporter subunit IIBCA [Enterococcus casseliflavus]OQO84772.1 PTS beta-glucoside transporter subunit EIIBCA [Enterococcus casselifl